MTPDALSYVAHATKRLVIAGNTFGQAKLLCEHLETLGSKTDTQLHVPLIAGICVTYMKPFVKSAKLGALPPKFSKFPNGSEHKKVHEDLRNARNWFFAHRDMVNAPSLLSNP